MIRGEFLVARAAILLLLTATGCGETRTPGGTNSCPSAGRTGRPRSPRRQAAWSWWASAGRWETTTFVLNSATITGDTLAISASYSGGCKTHEFTLVIAASFGESSPVRLPAVLRHDANGDACEAWPTESYTFDLALVRTRYRGVYGPGAGRVAFQLDGVLSLIHI